MTHKHIGPLAEEPDCDQSRGRGRARKNARH
jgi:hypothetical protein